jgi:hypothetical protein
MDPIRDIHEATNIALHAQNALGYNLLNLIPYDKLSSELRAGLMENTNWIVPLTLTFAGLADYTFPLDPIISISSKNIIVRRFVNKTSMRGSIKERWSQDDWEVTISGVLVSATGNYPVANLEALRAYCNAETSVEVTCDLLNSMGIYKIAIESYDFPFTKGVENQAFVIKAYSDGDYDLLIKN